VHGITKLMGPGPAALAKGLTARGIEPALPGAYSVFFLETVGAVCIILGLFTRPVAAAIAIEFILITFVAHWGNGFGWSNARGGWEYPLLWGLMFFAVSLRGGGPYSLDRKIGKEV
jgi:putative oxidoreductase